MTRVQCFFDTKCPIGLGCEWWTRCMKGRAGHNSFDVGQGLPSERIEPAWGRLRRAETRRGGVTGVQAWGSWGWLRT